MASSDQAHGGVPEQLAALEQALLGGDLATSHRTVRAMARAAVRRAAQLPHCPTQRGTR